MDLWLSERIQHRLHLLRTFAAKATPIPEAAARIVAGLNKGGRVYVFGNGGSASQAAHFAAELINRFYRDRAGLPAVALTTDCSGITAIANDSDFKSVFSRQLEALGNPGDTAIGITTSGKSTNVLEAIEIAKKTGMFTLALCGIHRDALEAAGAEMILDVPDADTPAVQEIHLLILHLLAERIEALMFP
ncbi:MAG: SIS domain-containing protein [Candidatus Aminicenantes bacterium]|nr:SIS domain-containing protein [Candidatus Aminicenantes bacterium]